MPLTSERYTVTNGCLTFPPEGYQNALDPASDVAMENRKTAWIQLAGHAGVFSPASPKTIWKRQTSCAECEAHVYRSLMDDAVLAVIPRLYREVKYNGNIFIEIEDLLQHFSEPNLMDIKMGTRTFLESEVTNPKLRGDLYDKMVKIDRSALTAEEHSRQAVTKLRYMQFREATTSSATLGFRIDAICMAGLSTNTEFKDVATKQQVIDAIKKFISGREDICRKLLSRFLEIRRCFAESTYFQHAELIGSSLLVIYDSCSHASAWMIDFAKTMLIPDHILTHRTVWQPGNHEEGYLTGLDSLVIVMEELLQQIQHHNHMAQLLLST